MFYIYHAFPLLQTVATQLESEGICSGLATDNAGSLAAVNSATLAFLVRAVGAFLPELWWPCLFLQSLICSHMPFFALMPLK